MMPEEGKTDSESSCSFFGKRKAVTRKNALCLRRKRTRKAVVPSSEKGRRLPEGMHYVCGENGLGKQLSPLRKRKAVIRKNALCMRRKRTRKAVVPSLEKGRRLPEGMNFVCRKIYLELPRRGIPYPMFFEILHRVGQGGRIRMTKNRFFISRARSKAQDDEGVFPPSLDSS